MSSNVYSNLSTLIPCKTLDHTFKLLRENHPSLALGIQNLLMANIPKPSVENIEISLNAIAVSKIVVAISTIAGQAVRHKELPSQELIAIHATLLDWLIYTQNNMRELDLRLLQSDLYQH